MRRVAAGLLCLAAAASPGLAQDWRLSLSAGRTLYDAGGDLYYPAAHVSVERKVTGLLRTGVAVSATYVNYRPLSVEKLFRVFATATVTPGRPLEKFHLPVISSLAPWVQGAVGIFASVDRPDITSTRVQPDETGLSLGLGAGVELPVSSSVRLGIGLRVWDRFDLDQFVGVAVRF